MKSTTYGSCEAMRCDAQAVGNCPRCDMRLCAACLTRHARWPLAARRQQQNQQQNAEEEQA